jgi:hypothetical protein
VVSTPSSRRETHAQKWAAYHGDDPYTRSILLLRTGCEGVDVRGLWHLIYAVDSSRLLVMPRSYACVRLDVIERELCAFVNYLDSHQQKILFHGREGRTYIIKQTVNLRFLLPEVTILLTGMTSPSNPAKRGGNEYRTFSRAGESIS